jgi:hypothetical protein
VAALLAGFVALIAALELGAGPEIVTVPLLLAGGGIGALASQLGAVTVSAVPDELERRGRGLQNTMTNLGASLGTALAGSILIAGLTSAFIQGIQENPDVPPDVSATAEVKLAGGIPFVSNADLDAALQEAWGSGRSGPDHPGRERSRQDHRPAREPVGAGRGSDGGLVFTRLIPTEPVGGQPEVSSRTIARN